jgi:hypothetical protein
VLRWWRCTGRVRAVHLSWVVRLLRSWLPCNAHIRPAVSNHVVHHRLARVLGSTVPAQRLCGSSSVVPCRRASRVPAWRVARPGPSCRRGRWCRSHCAVLGACCATPALRSGAPANPSLHPTRYSGLRPPPRAGELKRWAAC